MLPHTAAGMLRLASLAALASFAVSGCGPPPPRQPDPYEEEWNAAGSTGEKLNVRTEVTIYEIDERDAEGWSFFWGASVPVAGGRLSFNGLRVATGGAAFYARIDAWQRRSTVRRKTAPFIVSAPGYPGMIDVGEVRPEPVTIWIYDSGEVVGTYEWTKAGCSLEVTPFIEEGGRIRVRVHPVVAHREGGGRTRIGELETEVVVPEGDAVIIGGSEEARNSVGSTFFSRVESSRRYRMVFVLKSKRW
ncbi:MAG: hypothetical protein HYY18_19920 [Planctomycetes bacterium]|nr:hypothetical protein [Planctomycetota bacterium]